MPKTEVLREADQVLCCRIHEVPLQGVIHVAGTFEELDKLVSYLQTSDKKVKVIRGYGSGEYCPEHDSTRINHSDFVEYCPDCKCRLNEKKKGETKAQCPQCKKFFKVSGD